MSHDVSLSERLKAELQAARIRLWTQMADQGLFPVDGWRLHEETRERGGHISFVIRPVHRQRVAPPELSVTVVVPTARDPREEGGD